MPYQPRDPLYALDQGVALECRRRSQKKEGSAGAVDSRQPVALLPFVTAHWRWFVNTRKEDDLIESYRQTLQIKMVNSAQEVRKLSGGNQQSDPRAAWRPTRGC